MVSASGLGCVTVSVSASGLEYKVSASGLKYVMASASGLKGVMVCLFVCDVRSFLVMSSSRGGEPPREELHLYVDVGDAPHAGDHCNF